MAGPPGVEADEIDRGGGDEVLEAGLVQSDVAGPAGAGDVGGLGDGALDPGADAVTVLPGVGVLCGASGGERLVDRAWVEGELAAVVSGGGSAAVADRAGTAGGVGEADDDARSAVLGARVPAAAAPALRAGDLPGVPVDGECLGGVAPVRAWAEVSARSGPSRV